MEGECLCKAVKVIVKDDTIFGLQRRGHLCHCSSCRKVAGGLFGANLMIDVDKVTITGEENLVRYEDYQTTSGRPAYRFFCKTCGNPIKSQSHTYPGQIVLKMGIFPVLPVPEWEAFAEKRQTWQKRIAGCIQYKTTLQGERME